MIPGPLNRWKTFTYMNRIIMNGSYLMVNVGLDILGGGFKYFVFQPYLGKIPNLTNIFQRGWNQLVYHTLGKYTSPIEHFGDDISLSKCHGGEIPKDLPRKPKRNRQRICWRKRPLKPTTPLWRTTWIQWESCVLKALFFKEKRGNLAFCYTKATYPIGSMGRTVYLPIHEWLILYGKWM